MIQKNNSRKQFFGLVHSKYLCQHNGEKNGDTNVNPDLIPSERVWKADLLLICCTQH